MASRSVPRSTGARSAGGSRKEGKKRKCITCGEPMDPALDQVPTLEHPVCEADRLAKPKPKPIDYF